MTGNGFCITVSNIDGPSFYTFLGMVSTSLGLLSSIAGKYLIDIVTGYQMNKAGMIFGVMAGSFAVSLILNGGISRIMVN